MYLFQWLSSTEKRLADISVVRYGVGSSFSPCDRAIQEHLKSKQADLESTLVKIISAPGPYPAPGRALRNLVGRCLIALYTRGETRTLFDTLQAFLKIVSDLKAPDKDAQKMCVTLALSHKQHPDHTYTTKCCFLLHRRYHGGIWIPGMNFL